MAWEFSYGFFQCFCVAFLCFEYLCLQEITFLFCGWCWFVSGGFSGSGGRGVGARGVGRFDRFR